MFRVGELYKRLGVSGSLFVIFALLLLIFYLAGKALATALCAVILIPLTTIVFFRLMRYIQRHALWSVRNRLLFVYFLLGVLPLLLLLSLVGLGSWAFTTELAISLANSALDRRVGIINDAVHWLDSLAPEQRTTAAADLQKGISREFPGFRLYVRDAAGARKYPRDCPDLNVPAGWKTANGLLVMDRGFYAWAHLIEPGTELTGVAPLPESIVAELVPSLGQIGLVEPPHRGTARDAGFQSSARLHFPAAVNRLDVRLAWITAVNHAHLEEPNRTFDAYLYINSRPSAVFSAIFGKAESFRGVLFQVIVGIGILFLIVEFVAIRIGVRLSRRLTRAVNQLYEGTRRVLHGDFRHRIQVQQRDQLGELGESFNQMTANLERLFAVEKEKERLQTELEIAREVQNQLYPKAAPPMRGLKLTVMCDPARMVSGDYYDYAEVGKRQLAFAIGDVAGKGISAALLMATLQAALRAQVAHYEAERMQMDSARVITQLNQQIYAHTSPEKYATFFFALFDQPTQTLTYTNAGHLAPLLLRDGEYTALDSNGTVVGAFPFAQYDSSKLVIRPDDLLVCYTDGITEPENAYGEAFGEERLMDLVKKHAHQTDADIVRIVLDAVRGWTGTADLFDDMTLLLARGVQTA